MMDTDKGRGKREQTKEPNKGEGKRSQQGQKRESPQDEQRKRRSVPEWLTLGISVLIVAVALGIVVLELLGPPRPAQIEVQPHLDQVTRVGGAYHLPVTIVNRGGEAAEDLTANITLRGNDQPIQSATVQVSFLGAGSKADAVIILNEDPSGREVVTDIASYLVP